MNRIRLKILLPFIVAFTFILPQSCCDTAVDSNGTEMDNGSVADYSTTADYSTWTEMDTGTTADLYRIWGSSSTDVFAVGFDIDDEERQVRGVILHYDGVSWSPMDTGIASGFLGIWGTSSTDVFAVGGDMRSLTQGIILHYDGSTWSEMGVDVDLANIPLSGIWGISSTNVFAAGQGDYPHQKAILRYDGSSWNEMDISELDEDTRFYMWGSSPTDVFGINIMGSIYHYDGTTWSKMDTSSFGGPYPWGWWDIWGSSSNNVFALMSDGIIHYDGISWSEMDIGDNWSTWLHAPGIRGGGIWGSSSSNVFAAGQESEGSSTILHYDGSNWTKIYTTTHWITDIWGSPPGDLFVVGGDGTILHCSPE